MRGFLKLASWAFLAGGIYFAWQGASTYYDSISYQRNFQKVESLTHADGVRHPGATSSRPGRNSGGPNGYAKGAAIAKLTIPRLQTVLYIVEGTDDKDLRRGPGHVQGTALPGWDGNCVIAGHRDTHFSVLKEIRAGDTIIIDEPEGSYTYKVSGASVVDPQNTACMQPTSKAVLNLVTCFPFEYIGSAPRRFVVHADLQKT